MTSLLESVFNHVVLPPKLPGRRDLNGQAVESSLQTRLLGACEALCALPAQKAQRCWQFVRQQLLICLDLHRCRFDRVSIERAFCSLSADCPVVLYIEEQNCAILIRLLPRSDGGDDDNVVFEALETSPSSEAVLAAEGALQWDFPGRAAQIPLATFSNSSFAETLAGFLEQASTEALDRFAARSRKAGAWIAEARDTADPALISQMLLPLLEAIGSSAHVPKLRKRVRDDVNLDKAELPWRRSPYWLVLRVAVQRHLCLAFGNNAGRAYYKFLICTVLSQLLKDCAGKLAPELTILLRSKLCRRLAKLEMEMAEASPENQVVYRRLFKSTSAPFCDAIRAATSQVQAAWRRYRAEIIPSIERLPLRADHHDLRLSLNNSAIYLDGILQSAASRKRKGAPGGNVELESGAGGDPLQKFILQCFELSRLEMDIRRGPTLSETADQACRLAWRIIDFVSDTGGALDSGPEQASVSILSIFDLWVQLDKSVADKCPLLLDYHPCFSPELLNILQLATLEDMERLRKIQDHLQGRCKRARFGSTTIISGPSAQCFAARFMAGSTDLQSLQQQIEAESQKARERAETGWRKACNDYDAFTVIIEQTTCTCPKKPNGVYGPRTCERCRSRQKRKKLRAHVHEDFLPSESWASAALVFELGMPSYLAAYRDATWIITSKLAHPSRPGGPSTVPHVRLTEYEPLKRFAASEKRILSVASATKSFLQSHYKQVKMKVEKSAVLLPYSLDFCLYDAGSETWVNDLKRPLTFGHLCGLHMPSALEGSVLPATAHPHPDPDGPSSYEAVANQARCPPNVSAHEVLSYQRLLSGRARRWLTLLGELRSPHLNFNCEDTMRLVSQLAIQAGPAQQRQDILGDVHAVFRDAPFCACLAEQIERRLGMIRTNWREVYCMETLITLCLRLLRLGDSGGRNAARGLLEAARKETLCWIVQTREQRWRCAESDAGEIIAKHCLWASLLCRGTFAILEHADADMSAAELESYVEASVALQQSLELSPTLRSLLVRDMKMAHSIQGTVKSAIHRYPTALDRAVARSWANGTDRSSAPELMCGEWHMSDVGPWVSCTTSPASALATAQRLDYNFIDGRLLVDGSPMSRLPLDIRDSPDVKELFGDQYLLTYPSSRLGMSHMVARRQGRYRAHLGHRGGRVVVHAVEPSGSALEYVPSTMFLGSDTYDLPLDLVQDCAHWLDLDLGQLEIRRKPDVWRTRGSDWILDIRTRRVRRRRSKACLVAPGSSLTQIAARMLGGFADQRRLVISQPLNPDGSLSVELRNLNLCFRVNGQGLLECPELGAEVDPDQDAGTLYGFRSGLVVRTVGACDERSILLPLGAISWSREGMHVSIVVRGADRYGRFGIDPVLGQLACPPEPELLYTKALLHALTSFALPDPLTRRTGSEEAIRTLESGRCQPWQPLGSNAIQTLEMLRGLTPRRSYYPPDKRRLQTASWDESLTVAIQHESFEPAVSAILERSAQLSVFADGGAGQSASMEATRRGRPASWLQRRAERQRIRYERAPPRWTGLAPAAGAPPSAVYQPRDRELTLPQATEVYRMVESFHHPWAVHMDESLKISLQRWRRIGGFHDEPDGTAAWSLADLVSDDVAGKWGNLVDMFCRTDRDRPYEALFKLALLSFAPGQNADVLRFLAACHHRDDLRAISTPRYTLFTDFRFRETPELQSLESMILGTVDEARFASTMRFTAGRLVYDFDEGREERLLRCRREASDFAAFILRQWPSPEPSGWGFRALELNVDEAVDAVLLDWARMYRNLMLSQYIEEAQHAIDRHPGGPPSAAPVPWNPGADAPFSVVRSGGPAVPLLIQEACVRLSGPSAAIPTLAHHDDDTWPQPQEPGQRAQLTRRVQRAGTDRSRRKEWDELGSILLRFTSASGTRREYGESLRSSLNALKRASSHGEKEEAEEDPVPPLPAVEAHISDALSGVEGQLKAVIEAFSSGDPRFRWLGLADLWPWTSPSALLELLRSSNAHPLDLPARRFVVSYGLSVARLQRLQRIRSAKRRGDAARTAAEWRNVGHATWNPLDFPDWLLLEIDNSLLIRPEQVEVANAMLCPASGSNSVLQMNMGSGKTSCIVPMAMSILADGAQLARLVVPRALLGQTAQVLQARLGGLVGRDIIHVPFSRRTPTGHKAPAVIPLYSELHEQARRRRGIVLAAPEHLLSYKLSGLQRLADSLLDEAREMIGFQARLSATCRDVLDESDYTLGVRTQLIYPGGPQLPLDGQPHRWTVIQALLQLAEDHFPGVHEDFPQGLELSNTLGGFPVAHFLHTAAEDELARRIARDVSRGSTAVLARAGLAQKFPSGLLQEILSSDRAEPDLVELVVRQFPNAKAASDSILLVHGLLRRRILTSCLKKRWNVQYGFHPARPPLAVPFHAKGVPSEQSEFGHPDVALVLTCLAFYHAGITATQFRECLRHVLGSGDPVAGYDKWMQGLDVPGHLRHHNSVSLENEQQVDELWRILRFSRTVLNYYINAFVFPAHARQFDLKMQASGWDLPLLAGASHTPREPKTPLVAAYSPPSPRPLSTGFSGTNDNRLLLPLTIKQQDLDSLHHINAEVLTYLLQPRSRGYHCVQWRANREEELTKELSRRKIRILIDAGAYILERDNQSLVKMWLSKDTQAKAAVYFGVDHQPWVQYRNDTKALLISTPFAETLDDCIVYFDEAHTRGVDLRLPRNARGALTLALGQTKDHTVQAAMRLRSLGSTQAVVFFAPPEVHQSILDTCKLPRGWGVDSSHVVTWLLEQTCQSNDQLRGLHLAQGYDFCHRTSAQLLYNAFLHNKSHRDELLGVLRRPERQTLATLYGATETNSSSPAVISLPHDEKLGEFVQELNRQCEGSGNRNGSGSQWHRNSVFEEIEHEREVEFQVEQVRQSQERPNYEALQFPGLHPAIRRFAETGKLSGKSGYQRAFSAMASTRIGRDYGVPIDETSQLFVSAEYMRTITLRNDGDIDDFLRPVEWFLLNPTSYTALIVVPEEVELLIPIVRKLSRQKRGARVHIVTYVLPVSRDMSSFDGLLYSMPPIPAAAKNGQAPGEDQQQWRERLWMELGIFAGRLYAGFDECTALRRFIESPGGAALSANPAGFLFEWLALRRKGQDITHTPMGYVCQGWPLRQDHHLFAVQERECLHLPSSLNSLVESARVGGGASDSDADDGSSGINE